MFRGLIFIFLFITTLCVDAKAPILTPKDVRGKIDEILKAHVSVKKLSPPIVERIVINFINELDPTKVYFLESEVESWEHPSESKVQAITDQLAHSDFSVFFQIQTIYENAIVRRNEIEADIEKQILPAGVKSEEFKDISFAKTQDELITRCLRIKAMQSEIADHLNEETKEMFLQRIQKRRLNHEAEWLSDPEEKERLLLSTVLKATAESFDCHTNYFTPSEANQFMIQVQQRLFGIGVQLRDHLDGFSVMRILENSPASQNKQLKINDKIIAVNHEPVVGMEITEVVELIRGEKGTPVSLTVLRENTKEPHLAEKIEIELIRNEVVLEESRLESSAEPFGDGVIAHLRLFSFYEDPKSSSTSDVRKAIELIKKEHKLEGVILDLRGNPGGLLPQAVSVSGLFIHKGVVVSVKDNSGKIQHLREIDGQPIWDGPLVVLVNRASASAAEIVAQALQDYGRAIVVGDETTFGKGSFQTFTLDPINNPKINPQGEYKVTRGLYYTVSGKSPQLVGVHSDIVVPGILTHLDIGEKFEKHPLQNDEIDPHFDDDLSDLSPFQRLQLGPTYRHNLQSRLTIYAPYLEKLRNNSTVRLSANKNYQNVMNDLKSKNFDSPSIDLFGQSDLQQQEAYNIMKDLIFLIKQNDSEWPSAHPAEYTSRVKQLKESA